MQIITCQHCRAPVCNKCICFIENYECAKSKKCRWCGSVASPLKQIGLQDGNADEYQCAMQQFDCLGDWFRKIIRSDRKFDFSRISWQQHFQKEGWHFYVNANHFFTVQLPNQYDVVMAKMIFNRSKHLKHENCKKIVPFLQRFNSRQDPDLFFQSRQLVVMHTMSVMMLKSMEDEFFYGILKRVEAICALKLSNGLGVRVLQRQKSKDDSWRCWM
jgi:hypothetical protein